MNPPQIHPFDISRMLLGENPALFVAEVALRGVIIYVLLLVFMRLLGRSMAGQLSRSELAVMVTLGAAVGVPLQAPDRGILSAVVLLGLAVVFERTVNRLGLRKRKIEIITQGDVILVVADGVLRVDQMERLLLPRERLFAALRAAGIEHLGQVRRVYIETSGGFSIFRAFNSQPGLSVLPPTPESEPSLHAIVPGHYACNFCGTVLENREPPRHACDRCGTRQWRAAVIEYPEAKRIGEKTRAAGGPERNEVGTQAGAAAGAAAAEQ